MPGGTPSKVRTYNKYLGIPPSNADDEDVERDPDIEEGPDVEVRKKRKAGGVAAGGPAPPRADRARRASGGSAGNWIAGAIKHPGALHRQLGVPEGEKIPAAKLAKASQSDNPTLRRRANLAKTLKGFH